MQVSIFFLVSNWLQKQQIQATLGWLGGLPRFGFFACSSRPILNDLLLFILRFTNIAIQSFYILERGFPSQSRRCQSHQIYCQSRSNQSFIVATEVMCLRSLLSSMVAVVNRHVAIVLGSTYFLIYNQALGSGQEFEILVFLSYLNG